MADKRHIKRLHLVQAVYSYEFHKNTEAIVDQDIVTEMQEILSHAPELLPIMAKHAPKYPIDSIAKVDRAVLLVALYELYYKKETPAKVIINEAVEVAKEIGGSRSFAFINGVLGSALKEIPDRT